MGDHSSRWIGGTAAVAVVASIVVPAALAQTRRSGITARTVLDNPTLMVSRLNVPPTTAEIVVATAPPTLVVQATPGDVEITQLEDDSRGQRASGAVNYVPTGTGHTGRNIGSTVYDVLLIRFKPTRPRASGAPATEAPPGISRSLVLENDDVHIVRVRFQPGAREPDHAHPYDLLTMQIDPATVGILNGGELSTAEREAGFIQFIPRGVVHAFGSVASKPFEMLSIAIK